jgi:hypothetical protein
VKIGFSIDSTDRGIGKSDWTALRQPLILEVPLGSAEAWLGKLLAERKVMPSAAKQENVMRAVNSHATTVLEGWTPAVESMGLTGRNLKRLSEPFSGSEAIW